MNTELIGFVNLIAVGIGFNAAYAYINRKDGSMDGFFFGYVKKNAEKSIESILKQLDQNAKKADNAISKIESYIKRNKMTYEIRPFEDKKHLITDIKQKAHEDKEHALKQVKDLAKIRHFETLSIMVTIFGIFLLMLAGIEQNYVKVEGMPKKMINHASIASGALLLTISIIVCMLSEFKKESFQIIRYTIHNKYYNFWNKFIEFIRDMVHPRCSLRYPVVYTILLIASLFLIPPSLLDDLNISKTAVLHYSMFILFGGFLVYMLMIRLSFFKHKISFEKKIDMKNREIIKIDEQDVKPYEILVEKQQSLEVSAKEKNIELDIE